MSIRVLENLTSTQKAFFEPTNSTHRQYEALRAFFVEGLPSKEAAQRFGYSPAGFRVLCHTFRQNPKREFFRPPPKGSPAAPKRDRNREHVVALRKQNLSIYDISRVLEEEGEKLSPAAIAVLLQEEGFARLPRRKDDERPGGPRPEAASVADVRQLNLAPRTVRTKFGGLFLFLPYLARTPLDTLLSHAQFPGSKMIPAGCAVRALLALKLFGNARHSHVMSSVFDEGLALFAGLNTMPKRSFLTEYSCRITPPAHDQLMRDWFDALARLGLQYGNSLDLDFHTIPFHGEDALVQKHYVSKRSRRQKGLLSFLVQDAASRVFYYANAQCRKEEQNNEILRFVDFWKKRTGKLPQELVFDSRLTTYANLNKLNAQHILFITLQRRSPKLLQDIQAFPPSAWKRIELDGIARAYKTPKILDRKIHLADYDDPIRQIVITDFGHDAPTILLTNQLRRSPKKLITRYAQRMIIENGIADSIDFFHIDALSSSVPMKVSCDLILTLMASSLYRIFATQIGNGYATAKSRHLFRDFIDATAQVHISQSAITVRFQKRAHNPLLLAANFHTLTCPIPWLNNRPLAFQFG